MTAIPRASNVPTLIDLLDERRANVDEARAETCPTAKAMLLAHVNNVDARIRKVLGL